MARRTLEVLRAIFLSGNGGWLHDAALADNVVGVV